MDTTEHPNATAYRRMVEVFRAGDLATLRSLIGEDVVWHAPGAHALAGDIRGLDALVTWLTRVSARSKYDTKRADLLR